MHLYCYRILHEVVCPSGITHRDVVRSPVMNEAGTRLMQRAIASSSIRKSNITLIRLATLLIFVVEFDRGKIKVNLLLASYRRKNPRC